MIKTDSFPTEEALKVQKLINLYTIEKMPLEETPLDQKLRHCFELFQFQQLSSFKSNHKLRGTQKANGR